MYDAGLAGGAGWLEFVEPMRVIATSRIAEIVPALEEVERGVRQGYAAAGMLSYEASPAFDPALAVRAPGTLPLLWFGLFRRIQRLPVLPAWTEERYHLTPWLPSITPDAYHAAIAHIKDYIACGDTYQVNFTLRLRADFTGDPRAFFHALTHAQRTAYGAYLDLGDHVICSASPELFFTRRGDTLTCRPMKGTVARGLTAADDEARAAWLQASAKNRAENVMIVDMVRNDLSRIATTGSVQVPALFETERYDTLWQMTSTVTAQSRASLAEVFAALFPCASITGAPKIRTSEIIAELETAPRGIYTGAIGFVLPNGDAQFNVAIRTVHLDRAGGRAEYGTGGGVTWDSTAEDEYDESLLKARVLTTPRPAFQLLETLRWTPADGYALLDRHLQRLAESARYFDVPLAPAQVGARLTEITSTFAAVPMRVRLLVAEDGDIQLEAVPLLIERRRRRVALAPFPIDPSDRFLYHKTTYRRQYDAARAAVSNVDDVLLWNPRGELTESTIANLVIRLDGCWLTPPVACGLLAGTCRNYLLDSGRIEEAVLPKDVLSRADAIFLVNSVRGWMPVEVIDG